MLQYVDRVECGAIVVRGERGEQYCGRISRSAAMACFDVSSDEVFLSMTLISKVADENAYTCQIVETVSYQNRE